MLQPAAHKGAEYIADMRLGGGSNGEKKRSKQQSIVGGEEGENYCIQCEVSAMYLGINEHGEPWVRRG